MGCKMKSLEAKRSETELAFPCLVRRIMREVFLWAIVRGLGIGFL